MKTSDLIAALAADAPARPASIGRRLALALGVGALVSAGLFMPRSALGHDIAAAAHTMRFDLKFVDTLALAAAFALLCLAACRGPTRGPGALAPGSPRRSRLLAGAVVMELTVVPSRSLDDPAGRHQRIHCLTLIPLLSIPPLAALIVALREGAPRHPALDRRARRRGGGGSRGDDLRHQLHRRFAAVRRELVSAGDADRRRRARGRRLSLVTGRRRRAWRLGRPECVGGPHFTSGFRIASNSVHAEFAAVDLAVDDERRRARILTTSSAVLTIFCIASALD